MTTGNNKEIMDDLKRLRLELAYLRGRIKSEINELQANGEIVHSSIIAIETSQRLHGRDSGIFFWNRIG